MRDELIRLASLGWHLCPMESGTKNPGSILGKDWPSKCHSDVDMMKLWPSDCNVGVLLGSRSGIIDLEYDSEVGQQLIESWLEDCGNPQTPSYSSAKSVHRLFKWEEKFSLEKAKFGRLGVEFRFGNDTAQSVIPPSIHESGAVYKWLEGLSPWEIPVAPLPDGIYRHYLSFKMLEEKNIAKAATVDPRYTSGDSLLTKARNHVESTHSWESILVTDGWKFCRNRGEAQDWWRPGKTKGSISGTVNFGGSKTLRVFSSSLNELKPDSSYDKFAYLCATKYGDDPVAAAKGLCPQEVLSYKRQDDPKIDISKLIGESISADFDHEEFCETMVPSGGLIRDVYDYYWKTAQRRSHALGLASAVSLCQTIFGRRVTSCTDLRTNDYNVVVAPTSAGKESCENAITKILAAADFEKMPLIPPDVQSGNGLLTAIDERKFGLWIADEFGKVLEAVLDAKGNGHTKQIGTHLLKLYGKSNGIYGGAAHAAGSKHKISQPHLCLLGLTTGQVFSTIDNKQIQDGLIGRIAFWPLQNRPKRRTAPALPVPEGLALEVRQWIHWEPYDVNPEHPKPVTIKFTAEAMERWESHADAIDDRMENEFESRAAIWGRVAARSMKLGLTYRCARLGMNPATTDWPFILCELSDIEWGIQMANWLARISCNLIQEHVVDVQANKASRILMEVIRAKGSIDKRSLMREFTSITGGEIAAAANALQAAGLLEIEEQPTGGRKRVVYKAAKRESDTVA